MTDTQQDYARTDELNYTLVPLEWLRSYYDISRKTLERWLLADGIQPVQLPTKSGEGRERGIEWGTILRLPEHPTRWKIRTK